MSPDNIHLAPGRLFVNGRDVGVCQDMVLTVVDPATDDAEPVVTRVVNETSFSVAFNDALEHIAAAMGPAAQAFAQFTDSVMEALSNMQPADMERIRSMNYDMAQRIADSAHRAITPQMGELRSSLSIEGMPVLPPMRTHTLSWGNDYRVGPISTLPATQAPDEHQPSFDAYSHVAGLPGVSARCWADVWHRTCANQHEHHESCDGYYSVCNGPADESSDIGLCAGCKARMAGE